MSKPFAKTFSLVAAALVASGAITACTVFPTPEAPRVMDFPVSPALETYENRRSESLRVDTPIASEPYNSTRILAKPEPWEFQAYGGVRWRDTVPVLLRDMLVGAFRTSAGFENVTADTGPGNADLSLSTEVTAFHAATQGDRTRVTIAVYGQLIDNRSQVTLCSENFVVSEPASDQAIDSAVQAFGKAGESLADDVIGWALQCGNTSPD